MIPDLPWELCRSFLAVMRQGSLSAAARSLALTQPTVGRHVDALEARLGLPLFTRSRAGLLPTAAARELEPHAEAMQAAAAAMVRASSRAAGAEGGTVRISASEVVGVQVLPPILAGLHEAVPGLVLELNVSNRTDDLLRRDADIAVRMLRPAQEALVARRLGEIRIGLFAHRRYLARRGLPADAAALAGHVMVGFDRDDRAVRNLAGLGFSVTGDLFSFRCDNDLAQLAAIEAGIGIGAMQVALAARRPDLLPVLPETIVFRLELWLAMHEDLRASRIVRRAFDHLATGLSSYLDEQDRVDAGRPASRRASRPESRRA